MDKFTTTSTFLVCHRSNIVIKIQASFFSTKIPLLGKIWMENGVFTVRT